MITAVAFCPHPPALVPALSGSAVPELDELRSACTAAVGAVAAGDRQLVVLGSAATSCLHSPLARGSLAGYGAPLEVHLGSPGCGGAEELPLSVTVGAWLVAQVAGPRSGAVGVSVGPDFGGSHAAAELLGLLQAQPDVGLVVMGDGSARRTVKAPGYLDERAAAFDAGVTAALAGADVAALEGLDAALGADLLAAGVPAWRAAAGLLDAPRYAAELRYAGDPFGVQYVVATWLAEVSAPATLRA